MHLNAPLVAGRKITCYPAAAILATQGKQKLQHVAKRALFALLTNAYVTQERRHKRKEAEDDLCPMGAESPTQLTTDYGTVPP